jgi:lauroyl/myristoyl acyltransferase
MKIMGNNSRYIKDSPLAISLVTALGRILPLKAGHSFADLVAGKITQNRDSAMVRAIRANQWVAQGETLDKEALDQMVYETIRQSARSIFDTYHFIRNHEKTGMLINLDETTRQLYSRAEFGDRGLVVAGLHLSNFDLVLQWACEEGFRPLVLTIPDPQGGRRSEFERRKRSGMNIIPGSIGGIRQALEHLKKGGVVLTGMDRPINEPKVKPLFFGRQAALPVHHSFLATRAKVPVVIMFASRRSDGKYQLMTTEPIKMDTNPDREKETLINAEKLLRMAEEYILKVPTQWSISLPVWPETLSLVP